MTGKKVPHAFLDASALYPALLRNILMQLAVHDRFRAFWSARVQEEWIRAVLHDRPHLPRLRLERTQRLMEENIDGAVVSGYEPLIEAVTLPDADDRHVLAACIHCGASIIVTANLRDFPQGVLAAYGIEAQHPDAFIFGLFQEAPGEVIAALRELRQDLRNPPLTAAELLASMERQGLAAAAGALTAFGKAL